MVKKTSRGARRIYECRRTTMLQTSLSLIECDVIGYLIPLRAMIMDSLVVKCRGQGQETAESSIYEHHCKKQLTLSCCSLQSVRISVDHFAGNGCHGPRPRTRPK